MTPQSQKVERRKTLRVVEEGGAEGVLSVVVVDEVVVASPKSFFAPHRNRRMFRNFDKFRGLLFGRKQCMNYNLSEVMYIGSLPIDFVE